jgi:hypothetical protein
MGAIFLAPAINVLPICAAIHNPSGCDPGDHDWGALMPDFGAYQNEIYLAGLAGRLPQFPMRFDELEAKAHAAMPESLVSYVAGGCGDEHTQVANVAAFDKWGLMPRMFVGAKRRDLSVELFGMKLPSPLFMTPNGVIGLCAQDGHGDLATARAAALTGVPMVASTLSVDPLETVAAEFKATPGFFQLYTQPIASLRRVWSGGLSRPASRRSSSPWTPGSPAGGRAISSPPTSPSCGAIVSPTISPIRASRNSWAVRPRRICAPRSLRGRRSSATR